MHKNRLINEDCVITIKKMIKKKIKVNLLLTDPPYNVSRKHQLGFSNMGRSGMHFGEWDYNFNQIKWLKNVYDVINPGGSIIIFNDWKNMGIISTELEKRGFIIKDLIRWEKNNPMPRNVNRRYVTDYEFAIWAVKPGAKWIFNKQVESPYQRPIFRYPIVTSKNRIHPTQKPIKLLEDIIKLHSNKNDTIFDPFSGSGSTGIASLNKKRTFILIEKDINIYEKSKKQFNEISTSL